MDESHANGHGKRQHYANWTSLCANVARVSSGECECKRARQCDGVCVCQEVAGVERGVGLGWVDGSGLGGRGGLGPCIIR